MLVESGKARRRIGHVIKDVGDDVPPAPAFAFLAGAPALCPVDLLLSLQSRDEASGNLLVGTARSEATADVQIDRRRGWLRMNQGADRIEEDSSILEHGSNKKRRRVAAVQRRKLGRRWPFRVQSAYRIASIAACNCRKIKLSA